MADIESFYKSMALDSDDSDNEDESKVKQMQIE